MADSLPPDAPRGPRVPAAFSLVVGLVMLAFGAWVALHPLWSRTPVTSSRWLDVAFAFFFLLRGAMYLRALRRGR